jgi:hypothetical protein
MPAGNSNPESWVSARTVQYSYVPVLRISLILFTIRNRERDENTAQQQTNDPMEPDVEALADEMWNELAEASLVEHSMQIKGYDDVVKKEALNNNKVVLYFKKPSEIT